MDKEKLWEETKNISKEEFDKRMKDKEVSHERKNILFEILKGKVKIDSYDVYDIKEYAIKCLNHNESFNFCSEENLNSIGDNHEYDPAKNGQNIIKHGISFREVFSYSSQFGTLMVHFPHTHDEKRIAIFSDLSVDDNLRKLILPLQEINSLKHTVSIVEQRGCRFRFISARLLSSNERSCLRAIKRLTSKMNVTCEEKENFTNNCMAILDSNLMHFKS